MMWNYKEDGPDKRHVGPTAQDFHAAFGLNGSDGRHISMADEGGVALAAVQGLNEKVETATRQSGSRIAELESHNAELERQVAELRTPIEKLAQSAPPAKP